MNKLILTASLLSMLVITLPVLAEETHHPEDQTASVTTEMNTQKMATSVQNMQEMRKKIETEKKPSTQKELMHQHMQMMKDGMNMMAMMMEQKDTSSMPMAERMAMMEKKLAMMEKTAGQSGGMMGGASVNPMNDRMNMMEKKMMMMQEMMTGMMVQQEMMMK